MDGAASVVNHREVPDRRAELRERRGAKARKDVG